MKNPILLMVLLAVVVSGVSAQQVEEITIDSKELNQKREILVYTPMNYPDQYMYFNVIYVFDAHDRPLYDYANSIAQLTKESHNGFIVVGIKAIFDYENYYARNHDFLPSTTKRRLGPKKGNAENFLKYIKNEVIPYVDTNYRTLKHRTAIGHSLGASFLIYSMLHEPAIFDNYIAISPNLSDDDERLVKGLANFSPEQDSTLKFLYVSHADEANNKNYRGWDVANENAYKILKNDLKTEHLNVVVETYPNESHRTGYVPSVKSAISIYMDEIEPVQKKILSKETYEVTFKVKVPNEDDEIFISGNQENLGNWHPGKVKMKKVSPLDREITLQVNDPVEVKFTKGSWENQAWIKSPDGLGKTTFGRTFRPKSGMEVIFGIEGYK